MSPSRPACAALLGDADMQHRHVLVIGPHVDGDAERSARGEIDREQRLDALQVAAHAHAQTVTVAHDLGDAVLVDGVTMPCTTRLWQPLKNSRRSSA
jgi:hypothetical protein